MRLTQDPATPLLLEPDRARDKRQSPRMPEPCPPPPPDLTQSLEMLDEDSETIEEPVKTFLSFLWLWSGFFATSTSLALTHEKVPDTAPLPDLVLDNIRYQRLGLDLSEVLLVVNSLLGAVVVFSHVHRLVILRRVWLLLGILYYYRLQSNYKASAMPGILTATLYFSGLSRCLSLFCLNLMSHTSVRPKWMT